jgi:hypothetical protein
MMPLEHPVWGVDPSTRRIALAIVLPGGGFRHWTLELGPGVVDAPKLASARGSMVGWFSSIASEADLDPAWLWIEEPFGGGGAKGRRSSVPPQSQWMLAVVMEAAYTATGAVANLIQPSQWKAACGVGGFARKRAILEWARAQGFPEDCDRCITEGKDKGKCPKGSAAHDRADALGIAMAGAALVGGVSAVSETVDG